MYRTRYFIQPQGADWYVLRDRLLKNRFESYEAALDYARQQATQDRRQGYIAQLFIVSRYSQSRHK